MSQRKNNETFINNAIKKHGDKYDYSKVNYINNCTKVLIICKEHGEFYQTPSNHLNTKNCPNCNNKIKKKSIRNFIKEAIDVHGNEFDYSKSVYVGSNTKLIIVCKIHGEFLQFPNHHLRGHGCSKCQNEKRKLTTEIFIKRATKKHGNKFDYSKVNYFDYYTPIIIICPIHGEQLQTPEKHLCGTGCSQCYNKGNLTIDEFINRSNIIHNYRYDYSKVNYCGYYKPIIIICPKHGEFLQKPGNHLNGKGCQYCSGHKLNTENFIKKATIVHGNRYDYSKVNYIHNEINISIICKIHGDFLQKPTNHLNGRGCPKCSLTKGENIIKKYLNENNIYFEHQKMFNNCVFKSKLRFDFYLPDHNILIEFDGIQHFKSIDYFGGNKTYVETKIKDDIKNKYAKNNNIKLYRLSYVDLNNNIIEEKLNSVFNI
jgi:hypothetical protein